MLPEAKRLYRSKKWQFARMQALRRDEFMCVKCGDPADEVHHIIHLTPENIKNPKIALALDNLASLCYNCHKAEHTTARKKGFQKWAATVRSPEVGGGYMFDDTGMIVNTAKMVYLVTGCIGSGKTTYIRERMSVGDLVVDMDLIYSALSFQEIHTTPKELLKTVLDTRDFLLNMIAERKGDWSTAWVSATLPDRRKREQMTERLRAEHVFIETSKDVCRARVMADETRKDKVHHLSLIDKWFEEFENGK